jgi:hypothetical protein
MNTSKFIKTASALPRKRREEVFSFQKSSWVIDFFLPSQMQDIRFDDRLDNYS